IQSPSIIKQIARHLTKDELKTHVFYFSSLSQASKDDLRTLYLKEIDDPAIREPLLQIPNVAGVRLAFAENLQTLEDIFLSLTAPSYIDGPKVSVSLYSRELRYLKPEIVKEIMEGDNLCSQYKSAHRVCRLQVGDVDLHFKQKPSHPLMEYAIHNLTSRLAGNCTPPTVLVRFDLLNKSYPVLISQTIPGVALDASQPLDNKQWTWMLLAAILTRPGDGRPSNYTVHNQNIYCIDNDISFVEPVISAWNGRTVQFCSALFCLKPLDTPLNREVLQEFVSLDGAAILDGWIEDVIAKEQEYTALFSEAERKQLFEEDPKTACTFTILFREGTLANLNLQLWRLQTCIQKSFEEGSRLTVGDLLKQLISLREASIGAYVYKQYAKAMSTPFSERLAKATSRTQEASLTSVQYHQACLGKIPTLQEIERAKLYCPAKAREEFFFTLLQRCSTHAGIKIDKTGSSIEANFKLLVDKTRQTLVLKALASQAAATKPHTVILQHAIHLTNALLTPFIHPALKTLDLRYCSQIDNDAVDLIAQCPLLEKLYLSGTAIAAFRGGILSRTLKFLALKDFQIDRCLNLHTIQLRAPKLLTCTAKHNPLLETLQIKTAWNGTVDCANSPKAQVTHVQMECVSTLKGHTNGVTALVQLADGSLASGSWDNTIKLWDPVSGALKQTLTEHTDCISALVQLADGALASGSYDNTIKLWDPVSGALKQTLTGHTNSVCALVQLADGTLASGSYDKTIKLWDPVSGALKQTLKGHTGSVWTLVQLADGTLASVSNNNTIKLWDPVSGALKLTLKGHTSYVNVLVQLADGTLASGSSDETIKLWDPVSGALKQTLKGHTGSVRALVQLADGTLASGSFDTTIKLWDSISGALKQTLTGHTDWVIALVQLADGTLASGSSDNTIKLWQ
ncbi:MAG: hypothetical protein ACXWM7_01965, partial [Parachlamydiaceae bacterium]